MVEIGSVIQARVFRIESFGIFLKYGDETVCVLLPEFSWRPTKNWREAVHVGEDFDVFVLRYNYEKKEIVGSIRRLHQEQNPYRELSRLDPGKILRGKVALATEIDVIVELPNQARGSVPKNRLKTEWKVGDWVDVKIASLEVEEGSLSLEPVPCPAQPPMLPALQSLAGVPQ